MKKPFIAFSLSFFLPGAGLAYIGKWKWAFINFGVVIIIGVVIAMFLPDDFFQNYGRYIGMAVSGGSGGIAHALTQQLNQKTTL